MSYISSLLNRDNGKSIRSLIFFAVFFLYLWLIVQPNLIYYGGGQIANFPIFYTGLSFFNDTFLRPGGPIEYFSDFLSQFLILSWAGSLILTVHAFFVCFFAGYYLKKISFPWYNILSFVPAILLLITYDSYTYHFTANLALLAALVFSALFIKYETDKKIPCVLLFIFLFVLSYLIAAGLSFYFALLCILYQVLIERRFLSALLNFASALLLGFLLTQFFYNLRFDYLYYTKLLPFSDRLPHYPDRRLIPVIYFTFLLLPLLVSVFGIWRLLFEKKVLSFINAIKNASKSRNAEKWRKKTVAVRAKPAFGKSRFFIGFNLVLPVLLIIPFLFLFSDSSEKSLFKLYFYRQERNFPKILELSSRPQVNDYYFNHAYNWALYHKGLLLSDMFSRQQDPLSLLYLKRYDLFLMRQQADIFYDLGCFNESEMQLVELFELYGQRPEILQKLALLKLAKNDINSARVYLGALGKTLFYKDWAKNYLKKIDADPSLSTDIEVRRLRSLMPDKDNSLYTYLIEERLLDLLQKNKTNKMAFEYLMAYYLFQLDLEKIVQNLPRLDDFNYQQFPRHIEEAILMYTYFTKKKPDLKGRTISSETQKRFTAFLQMANNRMIPFSQLQQNFGDTYEFYYYTDKIGEPVK